jgi:hypothetical protein
MLEEMHRHPDIEVSKEWGRFIPSDDDPSTAYDLGWQLSQDAVAQAVAGCVLDPALRPLADRLHDTSVGTAGLAWRYRLDGDEHNGGEFCWMMPRPPESPPAWWDDLPEDSHDLHTRLCMLEHHPRTGDNVSVMLELRPDSSSAPLWLEHRGELYPMEIGIAEYVERAIETRGLHGWQALFCAELDRDLLIRAADRRQFEHLQRLFPDIDYRPYLRRCDQVHLSMNS